MPKMPSERQPAEPNGQPQLKEAKPAESDKATLSLRSSEIGAYRLAINLPDLDRIQEDVFEIILGGKLYNEPIQVEPKATDGVAVEFSCPLLMAASICDTIRLHDNNAGEYPTRVYLHKGKPESPWQEIPRDTVLVYSSKGQLVLNPKVFKQEPDHKALVPIKPKSLV